MQRITRLLKRWLLLASALSLLSMGAQAQTQAFQIGVVPTLSPRSLLKIYESLRVHVSREMGQPVMLGTAPDFIAFQSHSLEGNYDLVATAAHLARLLQREKGWIPLATYMTVNQAILIVANDGPIKKIEDLRGKSISSLDPVAMLVIQTQLALQEQGLVQGRDYQFVQTPSFTSAAHAVTQKQVAMAIISPSSYRQLPDSIKQEVRVWQTLPPVPGIIWMAHPRHAKQAARLKQALLSYTSEIPEGREFYQVTGYKGMREVGDEVMRSLDPYADLTKPLLNLSR